MRILLIAHDYPPSESPQALRWRYLVRELVGGGHDVTVLSAALPGASPFRGRGEHGEVIHAVAPVGFYPWLLRTVRNLRARANVTVDGPAEGGASLNWRGRLHAAGNRAIALFRFPDGGAGWIGPAARVLRDMLAGARPDLVITSHEPCAGLVLWLSERPAGVKWVADLGDPVLSDYVPARWRRRAHRLEADMFRLADRVMVTNESTRDLLFRRHGTRAGVEVLPQGFDPADCVPLQAGNADPSAPLRILYTGRFYAFRTGRALFEAVAATPGVVLEVATTGMTRLLSSFLKRHPQSFRLLGALSHQQTMAAQCARDVLVCIGNDNPVQTPGKVFEYLGSGRPILYLRQSASDPAGAWVERIGRGWQCANDARSVADSLRLLRERKVHGQLEQGLDLTIGAVASESWASRGSKLVSLCEDLHAYSPRTAMP